MTNFHEITLEMSLKPFKENDEKYIAGRVGSIFEQWAPLLRNAEKISILLWTGDGSEILEYRGKLTDTIEWGRYIGSANPRTRKHRKDDLYWDSEDLHNKTRLYVDEPAVFSYADLKTIIRILKDVGHRKTGKQILVGETFDPGPEFAVSDFKFNRHKEICMSLMSGFPFVGCYATLNSDNISYAGYPQGIPQDTAFGEFFGRQSQHLLGDLGFDYIWLSNGFGFGLEPWNASGALFNGDSFSPDGAERITRLTLEFWRRFREEFRFPIKTRGTNMMTGVDLSTDAVPLREIYEQVTDLEPPPNSPWVSLDGDFGLELGGWMSHIARIPADRYPFRFYTHDPWWLNSPWLDRYERFAHDIHMPMSVSRITRDGEISLPTTLEFLSIDDSYGNTPDQVPNEVIPEILYSREIAPDAPGPFVWVYPFDEYHNLVQSDAPELAKVFFGDWYIRGVINRGFALNTVLDSASLPELIRNNPGLFQQSVLVLPVLIYEDSFFDLIQDYYQNGGKILLYGSLEHTPDFFLNLLGIEIQSEVSGALSLEIGIETDDYSVDNFPKELFHAPKFSDGGISEVSADGSAAVSVSNGESKRAYVVHKTSDLEGQLVWVRGSNPFVGPITTRLPVEADRQQFVHPASLLRYAASYFGYRFLFSSHRIEKDEPVHTISRHENAYIISGYLPNTSTSLTFSFPAGAPLFHSSDPEISNAGAMYRFEKAYIKECRFFVQNQPIGTVVRCSVLASIAEGVKKRYLIRWLQGADLVVYPEPGYEDKTHFYRDFGDSHYRTDFPVNPTDRLESESSEIDGASVLLIRNFTGDLMIYW